MIIDIPWSGDLNPGPRPRLCEALDWWNSQGIQVVVCEADHVPIHPRVLVSQYGMNKPTAWDADGNWVDSKAVYRFYIHESFKDQAMLFKLRFA